MNDTVVPNSDFLLSDVDLSQSGVMARDRLIAALPEMSPQLRKAARYVLDNPLDVGLNSIREIAEAADVKPNTLVRMARAVGFEGYEDFRKPYREGLRAQRERFPDKARWLQAIGEGGKHGQLFKRMAGAAFDNVEETFAGIDANRIKAAADVIDKARATYVLGVGLAYSMVHQFTYLAGMALDSVHAIPREGRLPLDDIAQAQSGDVLVVLTFQPFRTEVIEAAQAAKAQGMTIVAISDTATSPTVAMADHGFVVSTDSPQFFTSTVGVAAFMETLIAFMVADARPEAVERIERFHERRSDLGVYWHEDD